MQHPDIRGLSGWRPLARGGRSQVWQAHQSQSDRLVAVKVYDQKLADGARVSFAREAGVLGKLSDHPDIVTVHDAGVCSDNRPYLVMELCPGGSLTRWLDAANRPTEVRVRTVGIRVADALAAAHACGVVHRDIEPANIVIDTFGQPRLTDFALASVAGAQAAEAGMQREPSAYAPPEALDLPQAGEAGDVYSLAATLYALLAGRPPGSVAAAGGLEQVREAAARPVDPLPGVNWFLMDALLTALSSDPGDRPTAADFRDELSTVPAPPRRWKPEPLAPAVAGSPDTSRAPQPVLVGQPEMSIDQDAAAAGWSAEEEAAPGGVVVPEAPRRRPSRRLRALVAVAALLTVVASVAAWLVTEPTSSGAPVAASQSAPPRGLSSSADPSQSGADPSQSATTSNPQTETPSTAEPPTATAAPKGVRDTGASSKGAAAIGLETSTHSAAPFETVRISGTYSGGADTFVRVQRWEDGEWQAFPVPAKTDASGRFTAFVELGLPGRYRLRVLDLHTGVTSDPLVLEIRR